MRLFTRMQAVPFRLREQEHGGDEDCCVAGNIQPPKVPPTDVIGHGSCNDGSNLEQSNQ